MKTHGTVPLGRRMRRLGFILLLAVAAASIIYVDRSPVQAAPPIDETPGLVHGTTAPPESVNVQSLEPAPPAGKEQPSESARRHVKNPEVLKLKKKLMEEGLLKPSTKVTEDSKDHPSSDTGKEGRP